MEALKAQGSGSKDITRVARLGIVREWSFEEGAKQWSQAGIPFSFPGKST
jgi:hypothetical protein